jgi:hypothetical protein
MMMVIIWLMMVNILIWLVVSTYPPEKYEFVNWDDYPIYYGKNV